MEYEEISETLDVCGKTLTMYAGILGKMDEALGGFFNLDNLTTDKELQTNFVKAIIGNYDEEGNLVDYKFNIFTMSPADFDKILQWGLDHYTVFTIESSMKTLEKLTKMQKKVEGLKKNS